MNYPNHIAVIPDGNRRWANRKKLQPWFGHQKGVNSFEKILEKTRELNIPYLTFWASSWDNLTKRPKKEIDFLIKIYNEHFERIAQDKRIHQSKVKINVLGRWQEILPTKTQQVIKQAINSTKNYNNYFLTFLLAYNGTDEMLSTVQKIIQSAGKEQIKVSLKTIKENLWTKSLPEVDLIIRTGCQNDYHMSAGFMMWQTAYSQLYFTKTFFPDLSVKEFKKIIEDYSKRKRRLGS